MRVELNPNNLFEELNRYVGKRVNTHSIAPQDLLNWYGEEFSDFGGDCGILQEVLEDDGEVIVVSDWGMCWPVYRTNPWIEVDD